jgi:hypothetical protein
MARRAAHTSGETKNQIAAAKRIFVALRLQSGYSGR